MDNERLNKLNKIYNRLIIYSVLLVLVIIFEGVFFLVNLQWWNALLFFILGTLLCTFIFNIVFLVSCIINHEERIDKLESKKANTHVKRTPSNVAKSTQNSIQNQQITNYVNATKEITEDKQIIKVESTMSADSNTGFVCPYCGHHNKCYVLWCRGCSAETTYLKKPLTCRTP